MFDAIKKFICKLKKHPHHRYAFAVTTGAFLGEILVFIKQTGSSYHFLSLPNNTNRIISKEKFDFGIKNNILQVVEKLPKDVYAVTIKQYEKNESNN
jgi:hypothetical protein